jgi:acetyl-CoA carboxylase biotin carboxyl carrier protein
VEIDQIKKIIKLMQDHELTYFDMTTPDGSHLRLKKGSDLETIQRALASTSFQSTAPIATHAATINATTPTLTAPTGTEITSPMVGTFYTKPSPESPDFVKVGDTVSIGQTLCIIEAMKVMNEIKAEKSGVISAIAATDSHPVQFGDVLFRLA